MQSRIEYAFGPAGIVIGREPAFLRIMHKRTIAAGFAKVKMGPKIMRAKTLKKLAVSRGACGQFGAAFAVGEQHRAIAVFDMHRPDSFNFIEQRGFVQDKSTLSQFGAHGADGGF